MVPGNEKAWGSLREYERLVVFRLGRLVGTKGPGLVLLIPIIDRAVKVGMRTVAAMGKLYRTGQDSAQAAHHASTVRSTAMARPSPFRRKPSPKA